MKLSMISEIQHKTTNTNLDRNSVAGAYATTAINDLFTHQYKRHRYQQTTDKTDQEIKDEPEANPQANS